MNAYREQLAAKHQGEEITAEQLAKKYTPETLDKLDNAIRSMQRGLARVRKEHRRCVKLGIQYPSKEEPFPYPPPPERKRPGAGRPRHRS